MRVRSLILALAVATASLVALSTPAQAAANKRVCKTPSRVHHADICRIPVPRRDSVPYTTPIPRRY